jgi:hypothetical protein
MVCGIIRVNLRIQTKFALAFGLTGFLVGATLGAYTFYLTPSHYTGGPPPVVLYLLLCPPSFGAMALDNDGVVGGLIGWFIISTMNAALYGAIGLGFGERAKREQV